MYCSMKRYENPQTVNSGAVTQTQACWHEDIAVHSCWAKRKHTLKLCGEDAIILLAERALLLIDCTTDDILHLIHGE